LTYVDWIKLDSQGTDLRLYKSLPTFISRSNLVVQFEPGFIDAYKNEDKAHHILSYMDDKPFWLCDLSIKGSLRMSREYFSSLPYYITKFITGFHRTSPCWCEMTYVRKDFDRMGHRDLLLLSLINVSNKQYHEALSIAKFGASKFDCNYFHQVIKFCDFKIRFNVMFFFKKIINSVFG